VLFVSQAVLFVWQAVLFVWQAVLFVWQAVLFVWQAVRLSKAQSSLLSATYDVTPRGFAFCWECSGSERHMLQYPKDSTNWRFPQVSCELTKSSCLYKTERIR